MSDKWKAFLHLLEDEVDKAKKIVGSIASDDDDDDKTVTPAKKQTGCSCKIPTPCWLPEDLGDWDVTIEDGGRAQLRLRIRNTDGKQSTITASVSGTGAQFVAPPNASVTLPAYGRGTMTFDVNVPQPTQPGTYVDAQVAVQGCRKHLLNWRIEVVAKADPGAKAGREIHVKDGPDLVHHWYDHFYCVRTCRS